MPQLQPFWDSAYSVADPGPYVGDTFTANTWDTMRLGGNQVPGKVTVSISIARHLDIKTLPGAQPFVTPIGYEPTRITVSVLLWTPDQWAIMQPIMWAIMPILNRPPAGAKHTASAQNTFDIFHPKIANMGVSSALCTKLGDLSGDQSKTLAIEFLANRRGKSAVFTVQEAQVAAPYDAAALAAQSVQPLTGSPTVYSQTQGPQVPPSQNPRL